MGQVGRYLCHIRPSLASKQTEFTDVITGSVHFIRTGSVEVHVELEIQRISVQVCRNFTQFSVCSVFGIDLCVVSTQVGKEDEVIVRQL